MPAGPLTREILEAPPAEELNLFLRGTEHARARNWFLSHYDTADDVSNDVLAMLRESWAGDWVDPEDLYFRVLAEYFRATLEGLDIEADDNPMSEAMTDFQEDAYHYAKSILRRYGGVFLADVVGLGKTFIGLALIRHLQDRYGQHAVVVSPPAVGAAWRDLAAEFRVELQTVSHGKLEDLDRYRDREVLVIDESHNFRNVDTQRYERIHEWLRPDGASSERKVILISATPQNNRPQDVLHQVRLFPDTYQRLPYVGESLDDYFRKVKAGEHSLRTLLQHVIVRRTRRFVQSVYPDSSIRVRLGPGQYGRRPLRFPTRVCGSEQALRYQIESTYGRELYDQIVLSLRRMRYPVYALALYVRSSAADDPRVQGIQRAGVALRGLFKVLLLKRLESSVAAFRLTLERLRGRLYDALELLDEHQVRVRVVRHRSTDTADDSDEDLLDGNGERIVSAALFDHERLETDLWHDVQKLDGLVQAVARLTPARDAKLARLERYLTHRPPRLHRTVVFTQFADTAAYMADFVGQRHGRTSMVSGSSKHNLTTVRRFAPIGNRVDVPEEDQIDLLITTDALSEGVNLQDADTLVNFDLHWNPVRLIQRAGRIDRIGSPNDEIHVASFLPERALEEKLGLETILRHRIKEFVEVFGEDSAVLPSDEVPDIEDVVAAYSGQAFVAADQTDETLDALGRHAERILQMRRLDAKRYDRVVAMRPGRRAASASDLPAVVATRLAWFWQFWQSNAAGDGLDPIGDIEGLDALYDHARARRCPAERVTERAVAAAGMLVELARESFAEQARMFREQRKRPRLEPVEEWVRTSLERYRAVCVSTRRELVDRMIDWVRGGQYKYQLRRTARRWRTDKWSPEAVFDEMRGLLKRFPLDDEELGEEQVAGVAIGLGNDVPGA